MPVGQHLRQPACLGEAGRGARHVDKHDRQAEAASAATLRSMMGAMASALTSRLCPSGDRRRSMRSAGRV
jgi:hypothetical protein